MCRRISTHHCHRQYGPVSHRPGTWLLSRTAQPARHRHTRVPVSSAKGTRDSRRPRDRHRRTGRSGATPPVYVADWLSAAWLIANLGPFVVGQFAQSNLAALFFLAGPLLVGLVGLTYSIFMRDLVYRTAR
jgi:hypothetical protein